MSTIKKTKQQIIDLSGISKLRTKKGYTQSDLSVLTGIKERRIREIEQGVVDPSMLEVINITKSLGLDLKLSISGKFHGQEILIKEVK